jgi:hypothetical protein
MHTQFWLENLNLEDRRKYGGSSIINRTYCIDFIIVCKIIPIPYIFSQHLYAASLCSFQKKKYMVASPAIIAQTVQLHRRLLTFSC